MQYGRHLFISAFERNGTSFPWTYIRLFRKRWSCCGHERDIWKSLWRYSRKQIWRALWNIFLLWMFDVSYLKSRNIKTSLKPFLDTLAINLMTSLVAFSWCGTPPSQTVAVKVVMELSTKLTLSLPPSIMRMNVKQWRLQSAGFYQVKELKRKFFFQIFSSLDQDKAVIKNEFQYKNCCNDGQGI